MAALLGNLLCWHEEGISNAEWGERFYQWGVAAGISKGTLHTITFSMIEIARTLTWVGEDESGEDSAGGSYSPTKSKVRRVLSCSSSFSSLSTAVRRLSHLSSLSSLSL
jgi:hypothetical protein|tara:strand:- start:368 stop:694 length:327 start_codon:yes stop_codon:yes gene_type:complete